MIEMHVIMTADTVVGDLITFQFVLFLFKALSSSNVHLQILGSLHVEIGHLVNASVYALNDDVISLLEPCAAMFSVDSHFRRNDVHKKAHKKR